MSSASARSQESQSRVSSSHKDARPQRGPSRKKTVTPQEAYSYALRVAYLSYLLQPRARRLQHVSAPPKQVQRSSTSMTDLVKDFQLIRDSKSTKLPHGFLVALDKRITGVLVGREKMPEYNDPLVKRTFAVFLNELKDPTFRKNMEKDRRVEDLLLIFFSNATKELQKGKLPDDDNWKLMVDRHVALFIRLISSTLKDQDWARDRPELTNRLQTMEKKLLVHDQDLAAESQRNGGAGGSTVEVEVPRSYEVKDMPSVMVVALIFRVPYDQVQTDITNNRSNWTEKAALQDLKMYQANLSLHTKRTLTNDDFDSEEAYEAWKKAEIPDVSQMMLAIIQSNMELAKTTTNGTLPQFKANSGPASDSSYSDMSRKMSDQSDSTSSYVIDQPVDMSTLGLKEDPLRVPADEDVPYVLIPPEPRAYYRAVVREALSFDLQDHNLQPSEPTSEAPAIKLLSKQSTELLTEIALRWRVPQFSRLVLFLDVIREKYQQQDIGLDTLDAAFHYVKDTHVDTKKSGRTSLPIQNLFFDRTKWTVADFALYQTILSSLHDALLRGLYELMLYCYDSKVPPFGPVMYMLDEHIYSDSMFTKTPEDLDQFSDQLRDALRQKVAQIYREMLAKNLPNTVEEWEFFHVIQLGKDVVKLAEKIQKRYRKHPVIMGSVLFRRGIVRKNLTFY